MFFLLIMRMGVMLMIRVFILRFHKSHYVLIIAAKNALIELTIIQRDS